jgi:hypothetical protein
MRTKILVAGFACLSVWAVAQQQSGNKQEQPSKASTVKSPRDIATGQASGRRLNQKAEEQAADPNATAREVSTGKATGKTTAHDDWHAQSAVASGEPHVKNVSSSDDPAAVRESPTKASSGLRESPTKASSGLRESPTPASSDVRESPSKGSLGVRESPSKQTTQVSAGDVDGDGKADKTASPSSVQSPRDSSTGMASGKRQHGAISVTKREQAPPSTDSAPRK